MEKKWWIILLILLLIIGIVIGFFVGKAVASKKSSDTLYGSPNNELSEDDKEQGVFRGHNSYEDNILSYDYDVPPFG